MPLSVSHQPAASHMVLSMTGTLTAADYECHVPQIERLLERYEKINVLVHMIDFDGWEPGALWEDMKVNMTHRDAVERIAFVGDNVLRRWMLKFCKPFAGAKPEFFGSSARKAAERWLGEGRAAPGEVCF